MAGRTRRRVGYSVRRMRSGRWQVLVHDPSTGKHVGAGTYAEKNQAERAGQDEAGRVGAGTWIDPRRSDIQLTDYLTDWLQRRRETGRHGVRYAEDAARMVRLHIGPHVGYVTLTDLSPPVISRWYDGLVARCIAARGTPGLVPAKTYRLLHAALEDAVRDQLLAQNPCMVASGGVEQSDERPLLELVQVLDLADAVHARWRVMVLLAAFVALRFGELAGLRRRDVDLSHKRLSVEWVTAELSSGRLVGKRPKTKAGRRPVAIPPELVPDLEAHLSTWVDTDPDARVFSAPRGGQLRRSNFGDHWREARTTVGLEWVFFHDLRHFAGTTAAQHGATERELQARLGHASAAAARRYQHAAERRDEELAGRIGAALGDALRSRQGVPVPGVIAHPSRKRPSATP